MKYRDIIVVENSHREIVSMITDMLTVMAGEGLDSANFDMIKATLRNQGIELDDNMLFDVLDNLAIVRNISDNVVFFQTGSGKRGEDLPDPKKDEKKVDKLARKQVKKELKK
jgi:hypothetical protein